MMKFIMNGKRTPTAEDHVMLVQLVRMVSRIKKKLVLIAEAHVLNLAMVWRIYRNDMLTLKTLIYSIYKLISIVLCFHKYFILSHKLLNRIQDACEKFNGIFGIRSGKEVCCNKKCPQCGGKNCAKWKDDIGKKLGSNQCCKWKIIKRGKKCGSDGGKAPCML